MTFPLFDTCLLSIDTVAPRPLFSPINANPSYLRIGFVDAPSNLTSNTPFSHELAAAHSRLHPVGMLVKVSVRGVNGGTGGVTGAVVVTGVTGAAVVAPGATGAAVVAGCTGAAVVPPGTTVAPAVVAGTAAVVAGTAGRVVAGVIGAGVTNIVGAGVVGSGLGSHGNAVD